MTKLGLGIDLKDFDLDRVGFSISVLDETGKKRLSEGYLRMRLVELDILLRALRAAKGEINTVTVEPDGLRKFMAAGVTGTGQREALGAAVAAALEEDVVPRLPLRPKAMDAAE